jgi:hypothetical protein
VASLGAAKLVINLVRRGTIRQTDTGVGSVLAGCRARAKALAGLTTGGQ